MSITRPSDTNEYTNQKYAYAPGKAYPKTAAQSPHDYLDAALRAERYIASRQQQDEDGIYWTPDTPGDNVCLTLYAGSAGLAFFYSQLSRITGNSAYDDIAMSAATYLTKHWKDIVGKQTHIFTHDTSTMPSYELAEVGAAAEVLLNLSERYRRSDFLNTAREIGHWYAETARHDSHGAYWTGSTALTFDGGILLYLIRLADSIHEDWLDSLLRETGEWFLAQGDPAEAPGGGLKFNGYKTFRTYETLNFAYGTAGGGYVLALLYDALGDVRYLEAAQACERYLSTQFVKQDGGGQLLPYLLNVDEPTFYYLGHCHGPAGTGKFYYKLYEETGDEHYLDAITDMVDGMEAWGVPDVMSKGLWNTVNQCCGVAGVLQFFIGLYVADPQTDRRARWKALAERTAEVLLGWEWRHKNTDDVTGSDWPLAWRRVCPEDIGSRIGYIDGTAGVAAVLLQLYTLEEGAFDWPRFINDPFPERIAN